MNVLGAPQVIPRTAEVERAASEWHQASIDIGRRLTATAHWADGRCTWLISDSPAAGVVDAARVPAGGLVYQGSAGIALFLAELANLTGDAAAAHTATGAARHALAMGAQLPGRAFGFHTGRVGIAYACARVGRLLDDEAVLDSALDLLVPLQGQEHEDGGIDVIAGAAGAIPALLVLAEWLGKNSLRAMAERLGHHLLTTAVQEPAGWCWTAQPMCDRRLTGYAHGASGAIHAMVELYAATGDGRYRYAAEQGLAYERSFFDARQENWPDFRSRDVSSYYYDHRLPELQAMLRSGWRRERPPLGYMMAWCHGAPGIALARMRAYEVLGAAHLADEARAALRATAQSLPHGPDNGSLCHGTTGNCEPLLEAERLWPGHGWLRPAEDCMRRGLERARTAGHWPSGVADRAADPSLMLGDAGIGLFLLRLANPEVPSVLLVRGDRSRPSNVRDDAGALRRRYVLGYFGRTLGALETQCPGISADALAAQEGRLVSDVAAAARVIEEHVARSPLAERAALEEIWAPERRRYERALAPTPFVETWMTRLARPALDARARVELRFRRSAEAEVVVSPATARDRDERPRKPFVVHQQGTLVHCTPVGDFTALVLEIREPETIASCTDRLMRAVEAPESTRADWLRLVTDQLFAAYERGILELHEEDTP